MSNMNIGIPSAAASPVATRVIEVVAMILGDDLVTITPASRLDEDLQLDSLDHTELLIELEDEFSIRIADEVSDLWKSVEDIINDITKLASAGVSQ